VHKIQRAHATQGTTSHNWDIGRSQRRQRWSISMQSRQNRHCTHTTAQKKRKHRLPIVVSKCRDEIGWRNLPPSSRDKSWYSIVRRNPIEIQSRDVVQYVQYSNAPQHNTNWNSRLSWLLTTSFNADDCSSCDTSNPLFYIGLLLSAFRRRALPFRILTRADCPVSPTNATGGQVDKWTDHADQRLWRLTDRLQVTLTRHKQQANSERTVGRFNQTTAVMK